MKKGLIALSPLGVFIVLYLVTSIVAADFYKVPITVAFMAASLYAIVINGGRPLNQRISTFSSGASTEQMMLMIWIFILAGAFASSAKVMGSIDATVNLTLWLLPPQMLLAGLFLAACFISLSIGTSVGTIVALTPIAAGVSAQTGTSAAMMTAIVVGGSFFGDNLSFISDTTIAATQTQGCRLSDKFRVNAFLVAPAALAVFIVYVFMGADVQAPGSYDLYGWFGAMGSGIVGMGELIIITMMAGGLLALIRQQGGIDFIISLLTRHVNSKRGAELSIAALVSIVNVCTANNTVAILTVGGIAKQIGDRFGLDNRKCASILDTFSCFSQGMLPYGAQILMAAGLATLNPIAIIPYLYYPMALGIVALLAIVLRYPRRYS